MTTGRHEEAGHRLCRQLIVILTEDDRTLTPPTSVGYAMMVVAAAWFMAAPLICVGSLMDRLLVGYERPAAGLDPEQAFWQDEQRALYGWQDDADDVQEVPAVVVDT